MNYKTEDLLIGIAGPLSGHCVAHAPLLHRATVRLSDLNIDWMLEDDKATPAIAVNVAHRFIDRKVSAVIGHFSSACAEAVIPLYRSHGIPLLLPASSQTDLTHGGGIFRLCSTDHRQAQLMSAAITQRPPLSVEVAIDNSAYSLRVLRAFQETGNAEKMRIVGITDPPEKGINCRLIFATCANAIRAGLFLKYSSWNGVVVYSDDAHIDEFSMQSVDRNGIRSFVIGSAEDYGLLIEKACELVAMGYRANAQSLYDWLVQSNVFSNTGNALNAAWKIYSVQKHRFIPTDISSISKNEFDVFDVWV